MTVAGRTKFLAWVFTAIWCVAAIAALRTEPAAENSVLGMLLAAAPWVVGCLLMTLHSTRRELLAWSFLLSALIFLGQAAVIYGSGWPSAADPVFLLLRIPLHIGIFMGLNLAAAGLEPSPLDKSLLQRLASPVAFIVPLLESAKVQTGSGWTGELAYCFLIFFAALAAFEVISGKRVLLHRWFTSLVLILLIAPLTWIKVFPWLRDRPNSRGATFVETRSIEHGPPRNDSRATFDFDFALPKVVGKIGYGRATVHLESTAAVSKDVGTWVLPSEGRYSILVDDWNSAGHQRIRGEVALPGYTLVAAAQLAPKATGVFVTPDLRCSRARSDLTEYLACQSLGPFPDLIEHRTAGKEYWLDLRRFRQLPALPANVLSPFRYASNYIHEATGRNVEVRVWRKTARYVARFDIEVKRREPKP
ncbi:MAG: hypothetical protein IT162_03890 [Bryobacterales bacterium]|nr:hypothetical protein [Bryobacterales bacterium]